MPSSTRIERDHSRSPDARNEVFFAMVETDRASMATLQRRIDGGLQLTEEYSARFEEAKRWLEEQV